MNATLAAICAGLSLLQAPDPVDLGPIQVGERQVRVTLPPPGPALGGPLVQFNDWKFQVLPDGALSAPFLVDGAWGDVAQRWRRAQEFKGQPVEWRTRVMVFTRGEVLQRGDGHVVRTNRFSLEKREVDHVYESLARSKIVFEGLTGGRARVVYDVEVEDTPVQDYFELDRLNGYRLLSVARESRTNSQRFDTDEGRFVGPYRANLLITCLPAAFAPRGAISYFAFRPASDPMRLGAKLAELLEDSVRVWGEGRGTPISWFDAPDASAEAAEAVASQWANLAQDDANVANLERYVLGGAPPAKPWRAARLEWASLLPRIWPAANDLGTATKSLLRPEVVDVLASVLGDRLNPVRHAGGRIEVKVDGAPEGATVAQLAGFTGALPIPQYAAWPADAPSVSVGTMRREEFLDPERRQAVRIIDQGHFRDGATRILGDAGAGLTIDKPMVLEFLARSTSPIPFAVRLDTPDARSIVQYVLGTSRGRAWNEIPFIADGTWRPVRIELSHFRNHAPSLGSVWITAPTPPDQAERGFQGPVTLEVAAARIVPGTVAAFAPEPIPAPPEVQLGALASASEPPTEAERRSLVEAVSSGPEVLRLTALHVIARWPDPNATQALLVASRSSSPATAYLALRALAAGDTPEGWTRIREATLQGPFEHARRFGAMLLCEYKRPKSAATLSTLLTAVSWTTRLAAAEALVALDEPEAANVALVYLRDPEPAVRLAVASNIKLADELIERRLLFAAVNDTSEAVRLAAWNRLMKSERQEMREEAFRAIRNETLANRVELAALVGQLQGPDNRYATGVQVALGDRDARVRAAVVKALGPRGIDPEAKTREAILADSSAFVQSEFLYVAYAAKITLPDGVMDALLRSPYRTIREQAEKVKAGR